MKRAIYLAALAVITIAGLLAGLSCGTSTAPAPGGNLTVKPTEPGGTPGPDYTPGQTAEVTIENFAYSPATLTVSPGTTVTWTNKDSVPHTVTSRTSVFDSGPFSKGQTFSYTFGQKGSYEYYCTIHPYMVGTVNVQ
jgi:plastocyanin